MPAKRRSRRARTRRDSVRRRCREPRSNFLHDLHDPLMNAPRRGPWRPQHILTDIPRTCTGIRRPRDPRGAAQARESRGSDLSCSPVRVPRFRHLHSPCTVSCPRAHESFISTQACPPSRTGCVGVLTLPEERMLVEATAGLRRTLKRWRLSV